MGVQDVSQKHPGQAMFLLFSLGEIRDRPATFKESLFAFGAFLMNTLLHGKEECLYQALSLEEWPEAVS